MQVSAQCEERGTLLAEVWQGHAAMMHTVHLKLQVGRGEGANFRAHCAPCGTAAL